MKGKDLFTNIQEARQHISRLKREAEQLEVAPQENMNNIHQYVNEVLYSLNKNQLQIDKKHKELKDKLPNIQPPRRQEQLPLINVYKKQKRRLTSQHKSKRQDSTKIDDSISFQVQNRQIRMHSYNEKHLKVEFNSDRNISNLQILHQQLQANSKHSTPVSSHFRSRHFQILKKSVRHIDMNQESKLAQRKSNISSSYMGSVNKPYLHEFIILNGQINNQTPEFASFERVYESIMPKINQQIAKITAIMKQQEIQLVKLDGKKLAYLCLKDKIETAQLYDCLINYTGSKPQLPVTQSKYGGKDGRVRAINKIMSFLRMKSIRDKYLTLRKNTIVIQRFFKQQLLKLSLQKKLRQRNDKIVHNFQQRQNKLFKEWKQIKNDKRIEVHLNSVEVDEQKRLSMDNFPERQNIQLSRMFRLKDQNLIIIYVTGVELTPELLNYYYKMMDLAGITNYRERLIFITPEHAHRFPQHFSTTKLLYYSTRTMNQLRIITSDLPTILYPGHPCNQLLKICDHLGCYLFSGEPQKMKCFTTKSQTKRLLKNLCIQTLPSTMEMYDYGQFLNTFSVLIIKHPQVQTWILKIDDQIAGRGIAFVDIYSSKLIRSLLKKVQFQQQENQTFATQINHQSQHQEATIRIRDYLRDHLNEKLQIATPTVYRSYTDYMGRFIKKGGVIEAHPSCLKEQLSYPSVTFCLDPDGQYNIVTSYQKILSQPYRPLACSFPQRSIEINQLNSIIRQLCDSFRLRKMFGIFTIDFLLSRQQNKFWVLGIDPYINDYTSSFYLFDMLMGGGYFPDKEMYIVDTIDSDSVSQQSSPEERLATRDYVFIPHLHHRNLSKVRIKNFFKEARLQQFNFDVGNKEGICVILLDQLASGVLGLLSVSSAKQSACETIKRMLDFMTKLSSVKNVDYGRTELSGSSDAITLKDVHSTFSGMIRKGGRRNAKQRAVKQYEMSRNLQLIT